MCLVNVSRTNKVRITDIFSAAVCQSYITAIKIDINQSLLFCQLEIGYDSFFKFCVRDIFDNLFWQDFIAVEIAEICYLSGKREGQTVICNCLSLCTFSTLKLLNKIIYLLSRASQSDKLTAHFFGVVHYLIF